MYLRHMFWLRSRKKCILLFSMKWASTRQNVSFGFLTKWDSNQPGHLERLARKIGISLVASLDVILYNMRITKALIMDLHAGLRFCCLQTSKTYFLKAKLKWLHCLLLWNQFCWLFSAKGHFKRLCAIKNLSHLFNMLIVIFFPLTNTAWLGT